MTTKNPALAAMLAKGKETAQEDRQEPSLPPGEALTRPVREERRSFGTRMKPSVHRYLKGAVLEMEDELGRRLPIEEVLEALLLEMRDDPGLRARVIRRCGE